MLRFRLCFFRHIEVQSVALPQAGQCILKRGGIVDGDRIAT
jgi:hypothetical protein